MEELKSKSTPESTDIGNKLRPLSFSEYVGQDHIKEELVVSIKASKIQQKPVPHLLFSGGAGLGKTTLAGIIAKEKGAKLIVTSAPIIDKPADLASLLMSIEEGDVVFIDEIHALNIKVEESLYSVMEDFKYYINTETGGTTKLIELDIPQFTLVGATTKAGSLSQPLRDRFKIQFKLNFYTDEELSKIVMRSSSILNVGIDKGAALEIGKRSRRTARVANNILDRVSSYAIVEAHDNGEENPMITNQLALDTLTKLSIDREGLSLNDRTYMSYLHYSLKNKPSGVKTLSSYIGEDERTIETVIEPFLIQKGFVSKTQRGRVLTDAGLKYTAQEIPEIVL